MNGSNKILIINIINNNNNNYNLKKQNQFNYFVNMITDFFDCQSLYFMYIIIYLKLIFNL